MKIAIINGSPRSNGATGKILKEAREYLEDKDNIEVLYYDLGRIKMNFCIGCINCYKTGTCNLQDDVEAISNEVKKCDGIIMGSPTYGSNITGFLKNFMDRGHFIVEQSLYRKYGFSIATNEIAEGKKALNVIRKFFVVSGASRVGDYLIKLDFDKSPWEKSSAMKSLHKKLDTFVETVARKKRRTFFEWFFNDIIIVRLVWRSVFLGDPKKYNGILKAYEKAGIHKSVRA